MQSMADIGVTGILEMPPAGTLTGIVRRNPQGRRDVRLKGPDQLEDARQFVDKHGDAMSDMDSSPTWRMLVRRRRARSSRPATTPPGCDALRPRRSAP